MPEEWLLDTWGWLCPPWGTDLHADCTPEAFGTCYTHCMHSINGTSRNTRPQISRKKSNVTLPLRIASWWLKQFTALCSLLSVSSLKYIFDQRERSGFRFHFIMGNFPKNPQGNINKHWWILIMIHNSKKFYIKATSALKTEQDLEQACLVYMMIIYTFHRKLKSCLQKINEVIL